MLPKGCGERLRHSGLFAWLMAYIDCNSKSSFWWQFEEEEKEKKKGRGGKEKQRQDGKLALVASQEEKHPGFFSGTGPALGVLSHAKSSALRWYFHVAIWFSRTHSGSLQVVPVSDAPSAGRSMQGLSTGWVLSLVHTGYLVMRVGCVKPHLSTG